jgi:hypothetical protein
VGRASEKHRLQLAEREAVFWNAICTRQSGA